MNGYKDFDGQDFDVQDFNNEFLNTQSYDPSEYSEQQYESADYYNPEHTYTNQSYSEQVYDDQSYLSSNFENESYENPTYANANFSESASDNQEFTYISTEYESPTQPEYTEESIDTPLYSADYAETSHTIENLRPHNFMEEELTEAEIADIKRQKAAARRKKLAARERRRKKRMRQAIIRCSILLLIIILLIVGLVKLISGIVNHYEEKRKEKERSEFYATSEVTTEEPVADIDDAIVAKEIPTDRESALEILAEQAQNDPDIQGIYDNAATLPDILLRHLAANSELKDYAILYPAKINIVFDGNFTVDIEEGEVPLYLQFDERWGYADYSTDLVGLSGAGPTALSMACTYLKNDGSMNPVKIADYATEYGYLDPDGKTHWTLMTTGVTALGLISNELDVDKEDMIDALEDGKLIICKMSSGDFTTDEHYILIRDYKNGFFYLNDPNSAARSAVGWDFRRLSGQIDKMCTLVAGSGEPSGNDTQTGDVQDDSPSDDSNQDNISQSGDDSNESDVAN